MIAELNPAADRNSGTQLAVVIPVYNEENTIRSLVEDLHKMLQSEKISHRFIIVNDGSTDNSLPILETIALSMPQLQIYTQQNSGHGAALIAGYTRTVGSEWVFQTDSDYQYDVYHLIELWRHRNQYHLLLAERTQRNASGLRNIATWLLRQLFNKVYGSGLHDVNSPYRLMRNAALQPALKTIPPNTFTPNILIAGYFLIKGLAVCTTKINLRENASSRKSTMSPHILKGSFQSILRIITHGVK